METRRAELDRILNEVTTNRDKLLAELQKAQERSSALQQQLTTWQARLRRGRVSSRSRKRGPFSAPGNPPGGTSGAGDLPRSGGAGRAHHRPRRPRSPDGAGESGGSPATGGTSEQRPCPRPPPTPHGLSRGRITRVRRRPQALPVEARKISSMDPPSAASSSASLMECVRSSTRAARSRDHAVVGGEASAGVDRVAAGKRDDPGHTIVLH